MLKFDPKAEAFLRENHFAKLATLKRDGSPHLTPIWFMYEGGRLYVNTTRDRVKYFNIRRDPRVSLLVDNGYSYVIAEGEARVADERDAKKDIETLAIKYTGEEAGKKSARERFWKMDRVTLEVIPKKVITDL